MSPRDRLLRLGGGLALIVLGVAIFHFSKQHDSQNRAAILSIVAILVGGSLSSQGLRGRHDGPLYKQEPRTEGPAIRTERLVMGTILGWLVPGLAHWSIGRRGKAILYFAVITATFVLGILLAQGRNMSTERDWIYFWAYWFNGAETFVAHKLFGSLELDKPIRFLQIGFLYSAVACLLNVVVLMDFIATCLRSRAVASHADSSDPVDAVEVGETER